MHLRWARGKGNWNNKETKETKGFIRELERIGAKPSGRNKAEIRKAPACVALRQAGKAEMGKAPACAGPTAGRESRNGQNQSGKRESGKAILLRRRLPTSLKLPPSLKLRWTGRWTGRRRGNAGARGGGYFRLPIADCRIEMETGATPVLRVPAGLRSRRRSRRRSEAMAGRQKRWRAGQQPPP